MSPEEVIERLKTIFAFGISNCIADKIARDTTFAALEKQIPKKPVKLPEEETFYDGGYHAHKCEVCGIPLHNSMLYCDKCGNAIDWSDEYNEIIKRMEGKHE